MNKAAIEIEPPAAIEPGVDPPGDPVVEVAPPEPPASDPSVPTEGTPVEADPDGEPAATAPPNVRRRGRASGTRPEATPAATGEPGFLDVWSNPWARIYIDGVLQPHSSPRRGLEVPSGRHVVRLHNPELGLSHQETVVVPPGGRALVRAELRPEE